MIIDLLFTNIQNVVSEHHVIKADSSDHFATELRANCKPPKPVLSYITKRDLHKFDHCEFFEFVKLINYHDVEKINNVHRAAECLESKVENLVDQFAQRLNDLI